jgi:hypothetical protein
MKEGSVASAPDMIVQFSIIEGLSLSTPRHAAIAHPIVAKALNHVPFPREDEKWKMPIDAGDCRWRPIERWR